MTKNKIVYVIIGAIIGAIIGGGLFYLNNKKMGNSLNAIGNLQIDENGILKTVNAGNSAVKLANPTIVSRATTTLGTLVGTTTVYFKFTSIDYAGGETAPSDEMTCSVAPYYAGAPTGCLITLTETTGAASTRIYIGTSTGVYYGYKTATSTTLLATTTGLTTATIPTTNTAYEYASGNMKINNSYLYAHATADKSIKAAPGFVHTVTFSPSDAAATAGTIAILNANAAGNNATSTIYSVPAAALTPVTITLDQYFSTGIYVDFTTTADVNVSISYR